MTETKETKQICPPHRMEDDVCLDCHRTFEELMVGFRESVAPQVEKLREKYLDDIDEALFPFDNKP